MILAQGKLLDREWQEQVLAGLEQQINSTLANPDLLPEVTIAACDRLAKRAKAGEFDDELERLDLDPALKEEQINAAIRLLRRESLEAMTTLQLGPDPFQPYKVHPPYYDGTVVKQRRPLGVLLHIAAGNMDGLPVFTVIEGLLAGNINLLKLPSADNGLSVLLLHRLVTEEPRLENYVYVFDAPSEELVTLKRLARYSNAVVVWGGEKAVSAVRLMAPVGVKLIEWGHRLSFAYVTDQGQSKENLTALARHIMQTKQLLCSSCQTIFLDTESEEKQLQFAQRFLPFLEEAAARYPVREVGALAQTTLSRYTMRLEQAAGYSGDCILEGKGCNIIVKPDQSLERSMQFGNPLVKRLPREKLLSTLRHSAGFLQTAGLLCSDGEREKLTRLLIGSGVVRVTGAGEMSRGTCLDAHDGEYPLQRYTRIAEYYE